MNHCYALIDPRTGAIRYIGVTCARLAHRFGDHLSDARKGRGYPVHRWIRKLLAAGLQPELVHLGSSRLREIEIDFIRVYRSLGCDLLNLTDGGEGTPGLVRGPMSEEQKAIRRQWSTGKLHTEDAKEKLRRPKPPGFGLGHPCSEETRAKLRIAHTGKKRGPISDAHRARISECSRGRPMSQEARRKISEARKGLVLSEETRRKIAEARRRQAPASPETREKMSRALQGKRALLTADQVREIRQRYAAGGTSYAALAREYGQSADSIGAIVRRENYGYLPD